MTIKKRHFSVRKTIPKKQFSALDLRSNFGQFATGVCVITAQTDGGYMGITVNSFSSISLSPALVSWAISSSSLRYDTFANAETMSIHILEENQLDLCNAFTKSGDAFDQFQFNQNIYGDPITEGVLARLDVCLVQKLKAGDHHILICEVLDMVKNGGKPLLFHSGNFLKL